LGRSAGPDETAVARLADGVLEAGWLLALLLAPAFFDVYSEQPFEPDKAVLVRLLALLMAAAGAARAVDGFRRWPRPRAAPLLLPVALYVGLAVASAAFSLAPRLSLWGSEARGEGLVSLAAYVVIFAAMASRMRRPEQIHRAVGAIVAGSVPVTLYGLQQAAGLDVLDWQRTYEEWRVSTTLGNPIFAGSYLILALPVTLAALVEARGRRGWLALHALAAGLQLTVLALTGSRGPWLGAAAALVAVTLLAAALGRRRRLATAALLGGIAAIGFVGLLNVPGGPLEPLRGTRLLGRLGHILDARASGNPGDSARVRVWNGALALARPRPPLPLAEGEDRRSALRPLLGYGPETLQAVFGAIYDAEFARLERRNPHLSDVGVSTFYTRVPDRSHNELLDTLVAGGILGALAHLVLHGAVQLLGLRGLGLVRTRREAVRLALMAAAGGAMGALGAGTVASWGFVGVGLPLGLLAGWSGYVLSCAFLPPDPEARRPTVLQVAVLAALVGHFVDIHFGPLVVTGRLYFWALAGILVAAARIRREGDAGDIAEAGVMADEAPARGFVLPAAIPAGLLAAALAVTLVYDFVDVASKSAGVVFGIRRLLEEGTAAQRWTLALGVTGVVAAAAFQVVHGRERRLRAFLVALALALAAATAFASLHVAALRRTADATKVAELAWSLGGTFTRYALTVLSLALLLAVALALGARAGGWALRGAALLRAAAAAAVFVLTLVVGLPRPLDTVASRILMRFADLLQAQGFVANGLALFDRAATQAPWQAPVLRARGEAYLTASRRTGSPLRRQEYISRAEAAFARARVLDPLTPDHYANLARLALWRGELAATPALAASEAEEASRNYAAAARLVPANTLLLNEWAELDARRRDFAGAEAKLQRSLQLDPSFDYTHAALGDLYMARAASGSGDASRDYRLAAEAYAHAFERRASLKALLSLGLAYERQGDKPRALDIYLQALAMRPPSSTSWAVHEQLAGLYLALGNRPEADRHAQLAQFEVPERDRRGLTERLRAAGLIPPA